jgi:hypothetical protein
MAGGPLIRRVGRFSSSTPGRVTAKPRGPGWPSGRAPKRSKPSLLAVVAAVAAGRGIPFVCVPAGTRNHFAFDVGVDRHDVTDALDAFTGGVERPAPPRRSPSARLHLPGYRVRGIRR